MTRTPMEINSVIKSRSPDGDRGADRERGQLSLLPTLECPVLWRSKAEGGYALCVYLSEEEGNRTLAYLAKCKAIISLTTLVVLVSIGGMSYTSVCKSSMLRRDARSMVATASLTR